MTYRLTDRGSKIKDIAGLHRHANTQFELISNDLNTNNLTIDSDIQIPPIRSLNVGDLMSVVRNSGDFVVGLYYYTGTGWQRLATVGTEILDA